MLLTGDDDVIQHRHLREHGELLERPPDPKLVHMGGAHIGNAVAIDMDLAPIRLELTQHAVEQGRFAGAIRADQPEHFTLLHLKGYIAHRMDAAEGFGNIADGKNGLAHNCAPFSMSLRTSCFGLT